MRLGPYRLCYELGSGGMATVFLASVDGRAGIHRFVALKCLRPELAGRPDFAAMFFDEACIASQIHHPNVCSVLDFDASGGVSYIAMEHLRGETLSSVRMRLAGELDRWSPRAHAGMVARIIADACEGLHAAHELVDSRGEPSSVVHRDISPDNLLLTYDGCVKVLDFGVSMSRQNQQHTRNGVVKGKVSYLPPEVLQGQRPDRRSDVWGLGVVAWELVTGQRLFDGANDIETLRAISDRDIPAPSLVRAGLPVAIDRIVLTALQRDPARRYPTAREFGKRMSRFLAKHRIAFGLAELAESMERLFPNGRDAKRQLLEAVAPLDEGSVVVPLDTCEIMFEQTQAKRALGTVAHHASNLLRRRRSWLPSIAAAAAGCLLMTGWSSWHAPAEPAAAEAASPSSSAPPPAAPAPVERALGDSGYSFSVSPIEATGDTFLFRVSIVPAGAATHPVASQAARPAFVLQSQ